MVSYTVGGKNSKDCKYNTKHLLEIKKTLKTKDNEDTQLHIQKSKYCYAV